MTKLEAQFCLLTTAACAKEQVRLYGEVFGQTKKLWLKLQDEAITRGVDPSTMRNINLSAFPQV